MLLTIVTGIILGIIFPLPSMWKTDEITFVDIQYRSRPRTLARYASGGYELTDQNGNLYWVQPELTWQETGKTYNIVYFVFGVYRRLKAVSAGEEVIVSEEESIQAWKQDFSIALLILIICGIFYIRLFSHIYKELHHEEILECRKRIRTYEAKMNRRAQKKQCK